MLNITNQQGNANKNYTEISTSECPSSKRYEITNVGEDKERGTPLVTVDGNVNWWRHNEKQYGGFSRFKNRTNIDPASPLLGIYPKKLKSVSQRGAHSHPTWGWGSTSPRPLQHCSQQQDVETTWVLGQAQGHRRIHTGKRLPHMGHSILSTSPRPETNRAQWWASVQPWEGVWLVQLLRQPSVTTWMDPEGITRSEISQRTDTVWSHSHVSLPHLKQAQLTENWLVAKRRGGGGPNRWRHTSF